MSRSKKVNIRNKEVMSFEILLRGQAFAIAISFGDSVCKTSNMVHWIRPSQLNFPIFRFITIGQGYFEMTHTRHVDWWRPSFIPNLAWKICKTAENRISELYLELFHYYETDLDQLPYHIAKRIKFLWNIVFAHRKC